MLYVGLALGEFAVGLFKLLFPTAEGVLLDALLLLVFAGWNLGMQGLVLEQTMETDKSRGAFYALFAGLPLLVERRAPKDHVMEPALALVTFGVAALIGLAITATLIDGALRQLTLGSIALFVIAGVVLLLGRGSSPAVLAAVVLTAACGPKRPPPSFAPDPGLVEQIRELRMSTSTRACPGESFGAIYTAVLNDGSVVPFESRYDEDHPPRLHVVFLERSSPEATPLEGGGWNAYRDDGMYKAGFRKCAQAG